jgi:hypothetical protein
VPKILLISVGVPDEILRDIGLVMVLAASSITDE